MVQDTFRIVSDMSSLINDIRYATESMLKFRRLQKQIAADTSVSVREKKRLAKAFKEMGLVATQASRGLREAGMQLRGLRADAERLTLTWRTMGRLIASSLISRAISVVVTKFRDGLGEAKEFIKEISAVQTLDKRELPFDTWAEGLRKLSDAWGIDVIDQARAAYQALSNQVVDGAEAFEFMNAANQLALTSMTTTENAVKILSSAINAFDLDAGQATEISAKLFKTVELGRNKIEDIADSYGRVAKPAALLNIRMEELNAALATLTRQGVKPQEAMTQLNGIFIKLLKPTGQMKGLIKELGFDSAEAAIDVLSFGGFIEALDRKIKGSSTELAKYINRQRGLRGILALVGKGLGIYNDGLFEINNSYKTFDDKTKIVLNTAAKRWEIASNQIKNAFTVDFGQSVINTMDKLTGGFGSLSSLIGGIASNFEFVLMPVLAGVITALGKLAAAGAVALKSNPWLWIPALVGVALAGLTKLNDAFESYQQAQIRRTSEAAEQALKYETMRRREAEKTTKVLEGLLNDQIRDVTKLLSEVNKEFFEFEKTLIEAYGPIAKEVKDAVADVGKAMKDNLSDINSQIKSIQTDLAKIPDIARKIDLDFGDLIFGLEQGKRNPAEQLKGLQNQLKQLQKEQLAFAKAGDLTGFEDIRKRSINVLKAIADLQKEVAEDNAKATKKHGDLTNKQNEKNIRAQHRLADLQDRLAKARKKKDRDLAAERSIRRDIAEVLRKIRKDNSEIAKKRQEIKTNDIEHVDTIKLANEEYARQRKLLEQLEKVQERNLEKQIARKQQAALEMAQYEELVRQFSITQQGVKKLFEIEDPEKFKQGVAGTLKLIDATIKNLEKQGLNDEIVRQLNALATTKEFILTGQGERLDFLSRKKEFDQIKAEQASIKKLLADIEGDRNKLQDAKEKVINDARDIAKGVGDKFKVVTNLLGTKTLAPEGLGGFLGASDKLAGAKVALRLTDALEQLVRSGTPTKANLSTIVGSAEILKKSIQRAFQEASPEDGDRLRDYLGFANRIIETFSANIDGMPLAEIANSLREISKIKDSLVETEKSVNMQLGISAKLFPTANKAATGFGETMNDLPGKIYKANLALVNFKANLEGILARRKTATGGATAPAGKQFGGYIHGSDNVPAMLQQGEFVMNAEATKKFRTQLVGMNSGLRSAESGPTNNFGDFNINVESSGNESVDVVKIGRALRREIKRGRLTLT